MSTNCGVHRGPLPCSRRGDLALPWTLKSWEQDARKPRHLPRFLLRLLHTQHLAVTRSKSASPFSWWYLANPASVPTAEMVAHLPKCGSWVISIMIPLWVFFKSDEGKWSYPVILSHATGQCASETETMNLLKGHCISQLIYFFNIWILWEQESM